MSSQSIAPRLHPVVIVGPVGDLSFTGRYNRGPVQRDRDFVRPPEKGLCHNGVKYPLGGDGVAAHKDLVSLHRRIWIEFAGLVEEFSQSRFVREFKSHS